MDFYSYSKTYHWESLVICCGLVAVLFHPDLRKIAFSYFAYTVVGPIVILKKLAEQRIQPNEETPKRHISVSRVLKRFTGQRRKSSIKQTSKKYSNRFSWLKDVLSSSFRISKRVLLAIYHKHASSVTPTANNDSVLNCIVCLERTRNILLLPCKHICLCSNCADRIMDERGIKFCPLCRQDINQTLEIFI
ncbi:uncharacterized protein [Musca autumnalis]|uniref:uncharacterized protein n=1 Tax=Musca autumnalis TaxID=221902 RepID=UPI003CFAF884